MLLSELRKAEMLDGAQAARLDGLYEARDALVMAAFDVYEIENNLEEFVDTLKRIADCSPEERG